MRLVLLGAVACSAAALAGEWSKPVEVLHETKPVVTYRARIAGEYLVIEAAIAPGWHTFAIDNERRAAEKLAGRQSLGIDQPTRIELGKDLAAAGPWYQSEPADFSKPELRWYSWGFEKQAVFAVKVRPAGAITAWIGIRGQTCSETTCKGIDVRVAVPAAGGGDMDAPPDVAKLVAVR